LSSTEVSRRANPNPPAHCHRRGSLAGGLALPILTIWVVDPKTRSFCQYEKGSLGTHSAHAGSACRVRRQHRLGPRDGDAGLRAHIRVNRTDYLADFIVEFHDLRGKTPQFRRRFRPALDYHMRLAIGLEFSLQEGRSFTSDQVREMKVPERAEIPPRRKRSAGHQHPSIFHAHRKNLRKSDT
jgi:hypothetical protein